MKIVIVGGGTAGWIAAALFAKSNEIYKKDLIPYRYDITVVESDNIPIIGAGEGSTGILVDLIQTKLKPLGVTEFDFLNETEATLKLGIKFKDWNGIGTEYLSPIQATQSTNSNIDLELNAFKVFGDYHDACTGGYLMARGYSTYKTNKKTNLPLHSYHFDAHKVGDYLKKICKRFGVTNIIGDVSDLNKNINGDLKSITLKSGQIIEADYFIDCSGFSKVLIGPMGGGWVDYSNHLPVNSAMPYIQQYERDEDVRAETLAQALPNGWMWQIPTQQRYGCGYVYCDKFTTADKALEEMEKATGRKIQPLRNLKFDVGRVDKFWVNNVVAVGLSSGFLEPLQATSIHSTIIQLETFIHHYLHPTGNMETTLSRVSYNDFIANMFDEFKDLLQIHYMTKRDDSPFWNYIKNDLEKSDRTKFILEVSKYRALSFLDFKQYHGAATWGVWGWTLYGLDIITKEVSMETLKKYSLVNNGKNIYDRINKFNELQTISLMKNKDFLRALVNKKLIK